MAKLNETYVDIIVESFRLSNTSGRHGKIHVRPVAGQGYPEIYVECSRNLKENHPIGTKFRIKAKLTDRQEGGEYLYSPYRWPYEVIE